MTSMDLRGTALHEECMEIAWRSRPGCGKPRLRLARKASTSARNTCHAGSVAVSRWLLLDSATSRESGISAASSSPKRIGHPVVVTRVHDQRRARHLLRQVAHIDAAELLEEPHRVLRRRGAPLQLIEGRPVGAGAVGQELRGEHLAERGIVTAPADPGEIEIQCRGALFLVAHRPHGAPARIGAAQHQVG